MKAACGPLPAANALCLRPASPADFLRVATWIPDADACDLWAGPRLPYPFAAPDLEQLLAEEGRHALALSDPAGTPWGFAQRWQETPPAWHLGRLIIAPEARGHGYGRRLVELLIAETGEAHHALTLRLRRDNRRAHALYQSLGFRPSEAESTPMALFMRRPADTSPH